MAQSRHDNCADEKRTFGGAENRWDNFKNTQWGSMGLLNKVGQRNYLKFDFNLTPPLGTFAKIRF
jgi:hypothetical protein